MLGKAKYISDLVVGTTILALYMLFFPKLRGYDR